MKRTRAEGVAAVSCGAACALVYSAGIWPIAVPAVALAVVLVLAHRARTALAFVATITGVLLARGLAYTGRDSRQVHREVLILGLFVAVAFLLVLLAEHARRRRHFD